MKVSKGFTLIELLVTMAVAIILATVAVPNFVDLINRQRFTTEFNSVLIGLNLARSEAIKRREEVDYVVTTPSSENDVTGWRWEVESSTGLIRQASGSGKIDLTLTGPSTLTFTPLGRIKGNSCADGCALTVSHGNSDSKTIEVSGYGRISRGDS